MKSKILTKKTIKNKILQGINNLGYNITANYDDKTLNETIEPLIKYIERNTDIEIH